MILSKIDHTRPLDLDSKYPRRNYLCKHESNWFVRQIKFDGEYGYYVYLNYYNTVRVSSLNEMYLLPEE